MRLDKFLKVSRLIKRRTVANEACDAGRVLVNGKPAKASVKVKVGDVIEIQFGTKTVKVEVLDIQDTTKYRDLISIIDSYKDIDDYKLIFTKLDETSSYGNLLNIKLYSDAGISYVTNGQNVPDDIEVFDTQKIVKQLLGGRQ